MPKGGARTRSGPPPDPQALRRERDRGDWTTLPAEGRDGPVPGWPLAAFTGREAELWAMLWGMPQAVMWERNGVDLEVALYVRNLVRMEGPKAPIILGTLLRQQMDSLGLTTPGMRANRWMIDRVDLEVEDDSDAEVIAMPSARDRLKVVGGAAG